MAKGNTDEVVALLDTIMFASKDNPLSEIPLRVGRGNSLKNPTNDEFVDTTNVHVSKRFFGQINK